MGPSARSAAAKPGAVVEGTVADAAADLVARRPDRHRRRDHPGHGPCSLQGVGRGEPDAAVRDQPRRLLEGGRPALQHDRPADRVALGPAHELPLDGRAGVQHGAALEPGDHLAGAAAADDHGARLLEARQRAGVGDVDAVVAVGRGEERHVLGVTPRGRPPLDPRHLRAPLSIGAIDERVFSSAYVSTPCTSGR